jgi:signal transduction histidine kinase
MKDFYAVLFCWLFFTLPSFAQRNTERLDLLTKLKLATHDTARMDLQIQISDLFIVDESNAERGINHANIALILAQNYGDQERQFLAIDKLIKSYFDIKKDVKTATDFLNTMKLIDTSAVSTQNQALIFGHEGKIFSVLNDFDKAEKAFSIQLAIYNKTGYEKGKAEANFNIGELFFYQNNFPQALQYYKRALTAYDLIGDNRRKLKTLNAIGRTYGKLGNFTKTLAYSSDALLLAQTIEDDLEFAKININMGLAYQNLGRSVQAVGYYSEALDYGEIMDDYPIIATAANELGDIYHELCNEIEANAYYERGLGVIEKLKDKDLKKDIYTSVFDFHDSYGRDSVGYFYLKKITALKDELYNEAQAKQLAMNQIRYETEKRQEEVEILKAKQLEDELIIQNQQLQNYALIGLMLLAIAFSFILYNALRRKKANNERLEEEVKKRTNELEASNNELKYFNNELERSNNELERFAYIASHDLKSPLRNVISFLSLIKRKLGKKAPDPDLEEYLRFASNNAHQMHNLIQDVLEFSRFDRKETKNTEVDLNESLIMVMQNLQETMEKKNAVVFAQSLPTIEGNSVRLLQLFQNLVGNGIKYNENPKPRVIVGHRMDKTSHVFSVIDNGIGIDEEYHAQIFEMFKRLHTRDEYQGTGIGLALCKKIVDNMNGEIWLESEEGKGTTFYFSIPKVS